MKITNIVLILAVLFSCSFAIAAKEIKLTAKQTVNSKISRAVQNFTAKNSTGVGKVKITSSDVQGNWALIWAEAVKKNVDPAQYLLHKEKGVWKVLVMGTALARTGEEYKVPMNLRKKWNL